MVYPFDDCRSFFHIFSFKERSKAKDGYVSSRKSWTWMVSTALRILGRDCGFIFDGKALIVIRFSVSIRKSFIVLRLLWNIRRIL